MNEYAWWYNGSLESELVQNVYRNIVVLRDVMDLQTTELGFELPDLPAIGIHLLLGALPVYFDLLFDNFGVTISQQMLDAECDSDPVTVDESFVLGSVVGSLEK